MGNCAVNKSTVFSREVKGRADRFCLLRDRSPFEGAQEVVAAGVRYGEVGFPEDYPAAFDDLHGGFHAYVGGDEHLLQIVEHLCIDGRSTGNGPRQFREEARFGLLQTGVEFRLLPVSGSGSRLGRGIFLLRRIFDRSRPVVFPEKSVEIVPPESSAVYSVFS